MTTDSCDDVQRVRRQSETATALVQWFSEVCKNAATKSTEHDGCIGGVLKEVRHASLQGIGKDSFDPLSVEKPQMKGGPACFSILLHTAEMAKWLPHCMKLMLVSTLPPRYSDHN